MNAHVYRGVTTFRLVPGLRVIIEDLDNSKEIFNYDLTQANGLNLKFGTLTKKEDYWLFEGGDSIIAD